jgi:hypothetical protein
MDDYLEYIRKHRSCRTYRTYRPTLNILFRNSYTKTYVDEVTREDILKFTSDCFDQGDPVERRACKSERWLARGLRCLVRFGDC